MVDDPFEPFLSSLRRSALVDDDGVRGILGGSTAMTAGELAAEFERAGFLSVFQAEKLRVGQWNGLKLGPYALLCPIGRGGMGIVYFCKNSRLPLSTTVPRLRALKLLSPVRATAEPRTRDRFLREMQISQRLPKHPHLVRTVDTGNENGVLYLVMEYAEGSTAKAHSRVGPVPARRACRWFADVAVALHAVHLAGYIHRDVKPSNVMIDRQGRAKLLDFGLALQRGETPPDDPSILGGRGYTLGTLDYLPPEQATNAVAVGAETDIYALGCSLYTVLAGHTPFPSGTASQKLRWHQTDEPRSLNVLQPECPAELASYVRYLMSKRPEDRPQQASSVAAELERWAMPAIPTATRLSYDATWEQATLAHITAQWQAHRAQQPTAPRGSHSCVD